MYSSLTVFDLTRLELTYAPPYSSAKDPVNMLGFTAENILSGKVDTITYEQFKALKGEYTVLDVRTPSEVKYGAVDGHINIPVDDLRDRLSEVPEGKPVVVYCAVGIRAYIATRILSQAGYKVYNLAGGYVSYRVINKDYTK
jgi:rhodanese-related sulfurtransferase